MQFLSLSQWHTLAMKAVRVLEVAFVFELLVFLTSRWVERRLQPLLRLDADCEPAWRIRRREKLRKGCRGVVRAVYYFIALFLILDIFGIRLEPVLWSTALLAVVAVTAGRHLLTDIVSGFVLLAENQLAPGDEVECGTVSGVVEEFTLRSTRIRGEDGRLHSVANRLLGKVTNHSRTKPERPPADPLGDS